MGAGNVLRIGAAGAKSEPVISYQSELLRELEIILRQAADGTIGLAELKAFREGETGTNLRKTFHSKGPQYIKAGEWLSWYQHFYSHYYELEVNLSDVKVPEVVSGMEFVGIIAKGMTMKRWLMAHRRFFGPVDLERVDEDLDKFFSVVDRTTDDNYAFRTASAQEVDTNFLSMSSDECRKSESVTCMNPIERAVFGDAYALISYSHLDQQHYTLTPGGLTEHDEVAVWHRTGVHHQLVIDRVLTPIKSEFYGPREILLV